MVQIKSMLINLNEALKFISEQQYPNDDTCERIRSKWIKLTQNALKGQKLPLLKECLKTSEEHISGKVSHPVDVLNAVILFPVILTDGGLDITKVRECEVCGKFFIKTYRRIYCSETCSNKQNNTPYDPERDRDRLKVYNRVKWLREEKGLTPKAIITDLMSNKEYRDIVNRLKKQGVNIEEWKPLKEE